MSLLLTYHTGLFCFHHVDIAVSFSLQIGSMGDCICSVQYLLCAIRLQLTLAPLLCTPHPKFEGMLGGNTYTSILTNNIVNHPILHILQACILIHYGDLQTEGGATVVFRFDLPSLVPMLRDEPRIAVELQLDSSYRVSASATE